MTDTPLSLLERLRQQPTEASWKRLIDLYMPLIARWLRQLGTPDSDVDDLVQDVLSVVVRELPRFDHNQHAGAFRRWLRTVAVNRLRGYWRSRATHEQATGDSAVMTRLAELEDPTSDLARRWDREHNEFVARRVLELIEPEFTASTWQAFRRQVIEGAKPADVGIELGTTANAVLISKSRVLRRLRQEAAGLID